MRTINCDLCERPMELEKDVRFINIEKRSGEDKLTPVYPELEVCVFCKEKLAKILDNWS